MEFKPYNPAEIEPKWQKYWDDNQTFAATNDYSKPKFYGLIEFPYPSGNGLHVGHPRSNTAMDIISRKRRMEGHNVLFPIGWDAFGLPTENFAIKHNIHPAIGSLPRPAQAPGLLLRLQPRGGYHRSRLLQVDPVDLPEAVREGHGLP